MKYLERIKVVQFFLFEKQDVTLGEITGIFGPNGSGKSSLLDAVQIAMLGANSRLTALNAQADEQASTRSLRAYCLGQYGENAEHRARDNATTYITLIWRDTETGAPLSMGVCLYASADRDGHEVLGRYILPDIELSMSDHLDVVDGEERPRAWTTFRHQLIERSKVSGQDPLYADSERYIRAALLALRGTGSAPVPEAFTRAFRFALRMRFDKTVDQIVRNDVLEARPTNIKKFKEVTESFRRLAEMVAKVEVKIADGQRVDQEYIKASDEARRTATWGVLSKMAAAEIASEQVEAAIQATGTAADILHAHEARRQATEVEIGKAKAKARSFREQREAHAAHKDYGAIQTARETAEQRVSELGVEIANNLMLVRRTLNQAADSGLLPVQAADLWAAAEAVERMGNQLDCVSKEETLASLRPALKSAQAAFNDLFRQGSELARKLEEAKESLALAEADMQRVKAGRAPLLQSTQRLLSELGDHGVQATPVCDLVRVTDSVWQPVIEAYLGNGLEALLVSAGQEDEAFRIYRGLTGPRAIYGAKIAQESRQDLDSAPAAGTVAALITGDNPAAVAYLRRKLGDLRCATSDKEALAGQRTLTQDGMLVSGGEIERLKPTQPAQFRIGAGSAIQRDSVQEALRRWQQEIERLEGQEQILKAIRDALQLVAHEEFVLKAVAKEWDERDVARLEAENKTRQLSEATAEDYVLLGKEESHWSRLANELEEKLRDLMRDIGKAETTLADRQKDEAKARLTLEDALAASGEAQRHPEVDRDYEAKQWDVMLEKHSCNYGEMMVYANDQQRLSRNRMGNAINAGNTGLGTFLEKYREQVPLDLSSDWQKAKAWLEDLLKKLHDTQLAPDKADMDDAYRTSRETFRNDVAIALNNNLEWLGETMDRLNAVLRECPTFSNGERYRFRRVARPQLESLLKFVKNVAAHGPADDMFGGPGELPEEFRALLEDKIAPAATGVRSPLDDYREFFEFDIEILREDPLTKVPKVVGHLSKRLGPGSGGEHRAPLYVIAGAALASAYRLDRGNKDGLRLILLDEAFNKMDPTNIIATMRYLEELGLQVFMASPGENLGILTAFLHRYYDILRDVDNNAIMIEGREVLPETRAMFREDLPEFNPGLVDQELATMRRGSVPTPDSVTG
jgi:energy-coupling factor transporter ATP-binding protein EcfA2